MNRMILAVLGLALARIAAAQNAAVESRPGQGPSGKPDKGARFELRPGENYFRVGGQPAFVLGRNPAGVHLKDYENHFRAAASAGEHLVRIHFTHMPPSEKAGEIDPGMLQFWNAVLDSAEKHDLAVLAVLGVWAPWNDGSNKETWHAWDTNPFNIARGGPAKRPGDLFTDTPCRKLWLQRLKAIIRQWSDRRVIAGWEIFSELDLVTGATEAGAVEFTEHAAAVIRAADPWKRPITASQAGIGEWQKLLRSTALDFIEIHPYADGAFGGRLDDLILSTVRQRLKTYGKPVLIGESGLNSGPPHGTLDVAPRAEVGIRHAIWAAVVSGAMNGRALWWQDGYDQFEKADLCRHYQDVAAPAVTFVRGVDYTDFAPLPCVFTEGLTGAVIGNAKIRLGWFRDIRCTPPEWPTNLTSGQSVTIDADGDSWQVEFFDPFTGKSTGNSRLPVRDRRLRIALPEFHGSIAVRLKRIAP
jgi:hypothetical protein